jgi:hypothetical protein
MECGPPAWGWRSAQPAVGADTVALKYHAVHTKPTFVGSVHGLIGAGSTSPETAFAPG